MGEKTFGIGEAIRFGWRAVKQHLGFFIMAAIILLVLFGGLDRLAAFLQNRTMVLLSLLVALVSGILNLLTQLGFVKIALKCCDDVRPKVGDLFNCVSLLIKYFIGSVLYGLIILCGIILLIVPGIVWAVKFQFYPYFILEKGLGPVASLKMSGMITDGSKWRLFLFDIVSMGVILLGVLALLVGLVVAIPVVMVGTAYIYRTLLAASAPHETAPAPV